MDKNYELLYKNEVSKNLPKEQKRNWTSGLVKFNEKHASSYILFLVFSYLYKVSFIQYNLDENTLFKMDKSPCFISVSFYSLASTT
jgi:hypothetical protein